MFNSNREKLHMKQITFDYSVRRFSFEGGKGLDCLYCKFCVCFMLFTISSFRQISGYGWIIISVLNFILKENIELVLSPDIGCAKIKSGLNAARKSYEREGGGGGIFQV